ncbi:PRTRC system protein E [Paraburkholderia caribensis]|uniref:PRTRC system protein E n=1 Tax=Paraburkholderia caribensis TaxID=75105 RepID=UPI0034D30246
MFQQLEPLVRATGKVTLTLKIVGDQMAVVVMPGNDSKEAALAQPLVLTATPSELDEGFVESLGRFEGARRSLAEQVSVTTEILQAAEKSQVGKAQKALTKGSNAALPAPAAESANEDDEASGDDDASSKSATDTSTSETAASSAGKTDLLSLL